MPRPTEIFLSHSSQDRELADRIAEVLDVHGLPWTLRSYQWVDFRHEFADGCRELLRIWGRGYRG
jgi:hypothetical protein